MFFKFYKKLIAIFFIAFLCVNFPLTSKATDNQTNPTNQIIVDLGQRLQQIGLQMAEQAIQGVLQQVMSSAHIDLGPLNSIVSQITQEIQNVLLNPLKLNTSQLQEFTALGLVNGILPISLEGLSLSGLNTVTDSLNLSNLLDPNLGINIDDAIAQMDGLSSVNLSSLASSGVLTADQVSQLSDLELITLAEQLGLNLEDLPELPEMPIDTDIISAIGEAATEAAQMGGSEATVGPYVVSGILSVREVGDQLQKIKELLIEMHRDRLANEISKGYLQEILKLENDEDQNRRQREQAAEQVRNELGAKIQEEEKNILEKVVKPNIIENMPDTWADLVQNGYQPQFDKMLKDGKDSLLAKVKDPSVKALYEDAFANLESSDIVNKIATDKCPTADEINSADGNAFWEKFNQAFSQNCTWAPYLIADEIVTQMHINNPSSAAFMDLMMPTSIKNETEMKDGKPVTIRTKDEVIDSLKTVNNDNLKQQQENRSALGPAVAPANMATNISQKLIEEAQNWLNQIIEQGLSTFQDLLSGLTDQNGNNSNNNNSTNIPPTDNTATYDTFQAQNDLANAKSLLSSQQLLNENLTNQYLNQENLSLSVFNNLQSYEKKILYFLMGMRRGSGSNCTLPGWAIVSQSAGETTISVSGVGDITFDGNGNLTIINITATSQISAQNKNISDTQKRISALGIALAATQNLIDLLNKAVQTSSSQTAPTIDEISNAKAAVINLGAKAVNSTAEDLIQLDGDTQKLNSDVINLAVQLSIQRQIYTDYLAQLTLTLKGLKDEHPSCNTTNIR